tara:strand:- start:56 stop:349 length:294 start_codon:yes stop_codon:yes gene_type:complete
MSIKLKYWLQRNRKSIKDFIEDENIKSYEDVLAYCDRRGCDPITEAEYTEALGDKKAPAAKVKPASEKNENVVKPKRTKRSTKTQAKKKPRTRKAQD